MGQAGIVRLIFMSLSLTRARLESRFKSQQPMQTIIMVGVDKRTGAQPLREIEDRIRPPRTRRTVEMGVKNDVIQLTRRNYSRSRSTPSPSSKPPFWPPPG